MRFKKMQGASYSIKRLRRPIVLALAINVLNGGCSLITTDHMQNQSPVADFKQWVLEAETLREQGDLILAQQKLDSTLQALKNSHVDATDYAAVELAAGYNLFLLNRLNAAEQHLKSAYPKTAGNSYLNALADQYLANLYFATGENKQAQTHISNGLNLLAPGEHENLRLSLELLDLGARRDAVPEKAQKLLSLAPRVDRLPDTDSLVKSKLILKTVQIALSMEAAPLPAQLIAAIQQQSYQMLNQLLSWPDQSLPHRLKADATGKMAGLYRWQGRLDEALTLTDQAITQAQTVNGRELLAQLAAQKGDLLRSMNDNDRALAAYEIAVDNLYSIRADMPISLPDGRSILNTVIDPIYRNYVDLLLQDNRTEGSEQTNQRLIKAIDSMEAIKEADLQDFFLGRCSVDAQNDQNWKYRSFPNAAVFYPILLKDRIELVVKTDHKLTRHTVNVPSEQIQRQALALIQALQHGKDYRASSKQLFEWFFLPIEDDLRQAKPDVILYVPDRSLRAIPLSALSDGKSFVIEHYGIVTLPSLALQSLSAIDHHPKPDVQALLAGLSRPDGASIDQLPNDITESISAKPSAREDIIEELSLPSVEEEIRTVADKEKSRTLLNDQFTATALKSGIETGNYGKVHIASHGYFGKNAKDSFIMAYDQNMTLLDIKDTLEAENLKGKPIDLLTLSACKTAEGDDSMLLGFSGLAVKSNVLTAVGSLWSINDEATMEFMRVFYDGLAKSLNKAQAIREAQISMIKTKKFRHPFFWSPFILIGDWQ